MDEARHDAAIDALVVSYQSAETLGACLEALRAESLVDAIHVVDNASRDHSASIAREAGATSVTVMETNVGYGAAMNRAAQASGAPFLLLVNPDLEIERGAVEAMFEALAERPVAAIAGALVLDDHGREQRACRRRRPTIWRALVTALALDRLLEGVNDLSPLPAVPQRMDAVSGALLLVRRTCWEVLNGFDTGYFLHWEDLDLFARAGDAGFEVLFVPAARAHHSGGHSHRRRRLASELDKHRGALRYYRHHMRDTTPRLLRWVYPALAWSRLALRMPRAWWQDRTGR